MLSKTFSSTIFKLIVFIFLFVVLYMVYQRSYFVTSKDPFTIEEQSIIRDIDDRLEEVADCFTSRVSEDISNIEEDYESAPSLSPEEHFGLAQLYQHGKFGRNRDIIKARLHYEKAIALSEQTNHQLIGDCHLHIAQLFDDYAEEQSGFYMIYHYLEALKHGYEESIIHIGKLYTNGLHPYVLPDKMTAMRILSTFKNSSDHIKRWCRVQLKELSKDLHYRDVDALSQNNLQYRALPQDIVDRMLDVTNKHPIRFPYHSTSMDKTRFQQLLDEEMRENQRERQRYKPGNNRRNDILLRIPAQTVRNDSQNVHDHSLQNIGNQILNKLSEDTENTKNHKITDTSRDAIADATGRDATGSNFTLNRATMFSLLNDKKYPHVQRVSNSLMGDIKHSRFDKTEQEVFNLVWNRVKDNDDMKEMFMDNLNSCVENEHVVCSTGKIMRMLSTLDVVDDQTPDLKPEWVVRQEIMATIANNIKKLSPADKRKYESDNNQNIRDKLHNQIRTECNEAYAGVLQPDILENYMTEYLEYV